MNLNRVRVGFFVTLIALLVTQYVNCGGQSTYTGNDAVTQTLEPGSVGLQAVSSNTNGGTDTLQLTVDGAIASAQQATIAVSGQCNPGDYINTDICINWESCKVFGANSSSVSYNSIPMVAYTTAASATLFRTVSSTGGCSGSYIATVCNSGTFTALIPPPFGGATNTVPWAPAATSGTQIGVCILQMQLNGNNATETFNVF